MTDRDGIAKRRPTHSTARGIADELILLLVELSALGPRLAPVRAASPPPVRLPPDHGSSA